jgi:hypothetical protein
MSSNRKPSIEESHLADYGEEYQINDNGTAVDTESVQYVGVVSVIVTDSSKNSRD